MSEQRIEYPPDEFEGDDAEEVEHLNLQQASIFLGQMLGPRLTEVQCNLALALNAFGNPMGIILGGNSYAQMITHKYMTQHLVMTRTHEDLGYVHVHDVHPGYMDFVETRLRALFPYCGIRFVSGALRRLIR